MRTVFTVSVDLEKDDEQRILAVCGLIHSALSSWDLEILEMPEAEQEDYAFSKEDVERWLADPDSADALLRIWAEDGK